mmetsp:Transcript_37211/g.109806  ORF Transcript_37211/g.109806 Transcript_37211/m.109806 type:complete len:201 (-) Transcript_37211:44-646(-)
MHGVPGRSQELALRRHPGCGATLLSGRCHVLDDRVFTLYLHAGQSSMGRRRTRHGAPGLACRTWRIRRRAWIRRRPAPPPPRPILSRPATWRLRRRRWRGRRGRRWHNAVHDGRRARRSRRIDGGRIPQRHPSRQRRDGTACASGGRGTATAAGLHAGCEVGSTDDLDASEWQVPPQCILQHPRQRDNVRMGAAVPKHLV